MDTLKTERLWLRPLIPDDWGSLASLLRDPEVMYAYEGPLSDTEVTAWLARQLARYRDEGIGPWAVVRRADGAFLGQAGLSWQDADGPRVLEVGYLLKRVYWHQGYAAEAARASRDYAFTALDVPAVYSIIRDTNAASMRVAGRNGMAPVGSFVKHYRGVDMPHVLFGITRAAWRTRPDKSLTFSVDSGD